MTTSFYIRKHKTKTSASIWIRITEGRSKQLRFSTNHTIKHHSSWNLKTQSVRSNSIEDYEVINLQLKRLKAHIETCYVHAKSIGTPRTKSFYKSAVDSFLSSEIQSTSSQKAFTLCDAFELYLQDAKSGNRGVNISESTIKTIDNALNHIKYLGLHTILISELDMNWYYEFKSQSETKGRDGKPLSLNYISTLIRKVKKALRYAEDNGHLVHKAYKSTSFKAPQETASEIYLTEAELASIKTLELNNQHSLKLTRDLFMIGAYSGLRFSDYSRLTSDNIQNEEGINTIEVRCQKTKSIVIVPLHRVILEILSKYNGHLPPSQNDQIMNRNLKILGKLAGIDSEVIVEITRGGKFHTSKHPKYALIKTHTARRSFCTNAYLANMDTLDIMALSGHKTESNFMKYIKVTAKERAKRIARHKFFQ